ncbi:hypothetical protein [Nocardia stercoris]|uniref:Uncharacterized protein n=1 Tax=Nocardia stercoris TaxID=2483361 RepID=A0A3M2L9I2_9NOCA|nr:hypothetical protein [Nocardia stercoris]RMI34252.1 hypothetical protein EBN03_07535 [Nocardia stercoris]
MSWATTHEWWQTVRDVEAEIERRRDGILPWQPRYAEIFGSRAGLLTALRYRWDLTMQAQADLDYAESTDLRELRARNTGLLRVLTNTVSPAVGVGVEPTVA